MSKAGPLSVTGVILAGGASRRIGRDKALLELGGRPLIAIVAERLASVCREVIVASGSAPRYTDLGLPVVTDRFPGVGVLAGIHAGLSVASHEVAVVVACDMPFLNPRLLRAFVGWAEGFDVAILRRGGNVEPLHAAYRRTCLPAIEAAIRAGRRRVISFFEQVRVRYVSPEEVRRLDPDLRSFYNVNTLEEWLRVQAGWAAKRPGR
ncbi:MAG TPA: molybdenum cofactor guanylyltransferase [Chloroflexi bacterium]|nr:molybdenum cofactor guanylyltransferase [Chloroflexota bacterium]